MIGIDSYIYSYNTCIWKLWRCDDYDYNDLFGNVLDNRILENSVLGDRSTFRRLQCFLYRKNKPKPRTVARKRGYDDHGSLANTSVKARAKANQEGAPDPLEEQIRKNTKNLKFKVTLLLDLRGLLRDGIDP
jgi:hypothetical protein